MRTPDFDLGAAEDLARELFGLEGECQPLPSYEDQNFLLSVAEDERWVLRIARAGRPIEELQRQIAALDRARRAGSLSCPSPRASRDGQLLVAAPGSNGAVHLVHALRFVEGTTLEEAARTRAPGPAMWRSLGHMLAALDAAIAEPELDGKSAITTAEREAVAERAAVAERETMPEQKVMGSAASEVTERTARGPVSASPWDLANAMWTLEHDALFEPRELEWIQWARVDFAAYVLRRIEELPRTWIHGDANEGNILVGDSEEGLRASALIDFGDLTFSARVFELAIAGAYASFLSSDAIEALCELVRAYHDEARRTHAADPRLLGALSRAEVEALLPALRMRLVVSVTSSRLHKARAAEQGGDVATSEEQAWASLERFDSIDHGAAEARLLEACGHDSDARRRPAQAELRELRSKHVGPSLSLAYARPLHIVRGRGSYLFDARGRGYLDCVNNVCHVGHCHPRVVEAAQRQIAELNTNTRYLHENLVAYAERLASLLPDPLEVCYFVNSGSEANELALRLACCATGRHDVVAVEGGYHGHTSSLVDVSHYKHAGPGGRGAPDWVHIAACPDPYRGAYRSTGAGNAAQGAVGDAAQLGLRYAQDVELRFEEAQAKGRKVAAFLTEALIGCGGQVVPPDGWLRASFAHARAHGAVCIADEVQVGLGRVGSHLWAFEEQGAIPDIVTLGKPIGNGHPLAAVVTTREIADAFDNGMEFFATFGGNPVSCAVGLAVLDVLLDEALPERAARVGDELLEGFRDMAQRHEVIGDVRGRGLYIGVELVEDRATREPAPDVLASVLERCREAQVLVSSDGPAHNVLKIKPPLVFDSTEAALLLHAFETALRLSTQ